MKTPTMILLKRYSKAIRKYGFNSPEAKQARENFENKFKVKPKNDKQ